VRRIGGTGQNGSGIRVCMDGWEYFLGLWCYGSGGLAWFYYVVGFNFSCSDSLTSAGYTGVSRYLYMDW